MTVNELGNRLREMYETPGVNKAAMVHLFGIIYGEAMKNSNIAPIDVVKVAQLPETYRAEVNKGINLSQYVQLKNEYLNKF